MEDFTIALVQHASPVGRASENLETIVRFTRRAKRRGAGLVCFPELNITGHAGDPTMVAGREPVPEGPSVARLAKLARELDICISAGIAEAADGTTYNTQLVVGPDGFLGKQRKVHLSGDEYFHFRHGTALPVIELPFVKLGIIICYDNTFPELSRCLALKGAELLLCPHAARFGKWPRDAAGRRRIVAGVKSNWKKIHPARALDNGCYVAVCNTAGRSASGIKGVEANHAGGCLVVSPRGDVLAESRSRDIRDELLVTKLTAAAAAVRPSNFRNRRPEVFREITRPTG